MLAANIEADMQMGPAFLLPAIRSQLPLIEHLCHQARGSDRLAALRLGVQFAEFCGWLYQDYGECGAAKACTNLALDLAAEIDDPRVLSYVLMRKSNVATDCRETGPALGLANAALARSQHLTPRLQAVALRQKAAAHALLGEYDGFVRAREAARIAAAAGMRQDEGDLAAYCTPSYVEMEAGASLVGLGRPAEAIPIFEESRSRWPAGNLRDRLLCLSRLATAYAHAGDTEAACVTASEALASTRDITSARVTAELGRLRQHLAQGSGRHAVADLRARLTAAIGPAANAVPVHLEGAP
jgi:tetratricopeptide (TPR) repeat protein